MNNNFNNNYENNGNNTYINNANNGYNSYNQNNMGNSGYDPNSYNVNNFAPNNFNNNMDSNNAPKKKNGLSIVLVICIVIILALCGYIAYDKGVFSSSKDEKTTINNPTTSGKEENTSNKGNSNQGENTTSPNSSTTTPEANPKYFYDISKCSNCDSNYNYNLMASGHLASAKLQSDNKTVIVTIDYDDISSSTGNDVSSTGIKEHTVSFSKQVADIYYGEYSLDTTYGTLLFLMEDGTIEYIPILDAAVKGQIVSYGPISNVNNIVKLYSNIIATSKGNVGAYYTTFAQSTDGTLYDIMTILSNTGNYSYSG